MKQRDIAMIVLIASVSMMIAYFVANTIFGGLNNQVEKVKTISPISGTVTEPDARVFNKDAINPTVEVFIGREGQSS